MRKPMRKNLFPDFCQVRIIISIVFEFCSVCIRLLCLPPEDKTPTEEGISSTLKSDWYKTLLAGGLLALCLTSHPGLALIPDNFGKGTELNHNFTPPPLPLQAQEILKELKERNIQQIALDSIHKCIVFNRDTGEMEECSETQMISIVNSLTEEARIADLGDWWNDILSDFRKSPLCVTVSETVGIGSGLITGISLAKTLKARIVAGAAVVQVVGAGSLFTIVVVPTVAVAVTAATIIILCDEQDINFPDWLDYIWYVG